MTISLLFLFRKQLVHSRIELVLQCYETTDYKTYRDYGHREWNAQIINKFVLTFILYLFYSRVLAYHHFTWHILDLGVIRGQCVDTVSVLTPNFWPWRAQTFMHMAGFEPETSDARRWHWPLNQSRSAFRNYCYFLAIIIICCS